MDLVNPNQLEHDTSELKQLVRTVEGSGRTAWKAGQLLKIVRDKKEYLWKYGSFERYVKTEVGISYHTANNYIKIRECFDFEDINQYTLIGYLLEILKMNGTNNRKVFLDIVQKQNTKEEESTESKEINTSIIAIAVSSLSFTSQLGKISEESAKEALDCAIENEKTHKVQQKGSLVKAKNGYPFLPKYFKEVGSLLLWEPADEMGLVALFCLSLQYFQNVKFEWGKDIVSFYCIDTVREKFPDAKIKCNLHRKHQCLTDMQAEFEFVASNFIKHKHLSAEEKCDVIICWENDFPTKKTTPEQAFLLPPVLSLKKIFDTGKIELEYVLLAE